jgi:acyl-coenzyme A thioesterase PaaI-like protein
MTQRPAPEPLHIVQARRDAALDWLVTAVPYVRFLGAGFERRGDELTAFLPFQDMLVGNPTLPALHGGATAAFMEVTAIIELAWAFLWEDIEAGRIDPSAAGVSPVLPKTIDFSVDYLRSGLPRDAYARATVTRSGRRYASVHVECWQDNRAKPIAMATGHFLMPEIG